MLAVLLANPLNLFSLTIDDFEDGELNVTSSVIGLEVVDSVASQTAVGGTRHQAVEMTAGSLSMSLETDFGVLDHSQKSSVMGNSTTIWDGDDLPGLTVSGLGGVDLTQDIVSPDPTQDGFRLNVFFFDNANNASVNITCLLYTSDAADE